MLNSHTVYQQWSLRSWSRLSCYFKWHSQRIATKCTDPLLCVSIHSCQPNEPNQPIKTRDNITGRIGVANRIIYKLLCLCTSDRGNTEMEFWLEVSRGMLELIRSWWNGIRSRHLPELTVHSTCGAFLRPGDSTNFTIYSNDADTGQILTMSWDQLPMQASLATNNVSIFQGNPFFSWFLIPLMLVVSYGYLRWRWKMMLSSYNGVQNYSFTIYVNQCNTDNALGQGCWWVTRLTCKDILPIDCCIMRMELHAPSRFTLLDGTAMPWLIQTQPSGINASMQIVMLDYWCLDFDANHDELWTDQSQTGFTHRTIHIPCSSFCCFFAIWWWNNHTSGCWCFSFAIMLVMGAKMQRVLLMDCLSSTLIPSLIVLSSGFWWAFVVWRMQQIFTSVTHDENGSGSLNGLVCPRPKWIPGNGLTEHSPF